MAKEKHRHATTYDGIASSSLSIDEFLLLDATDFEAVGLVAGGSAYHIGLQQLLGSTGGELEVATRALYQARRSTMHRLEMQARHREAAGIIDFRLQIENPQDSYGVVQVLGYGSAVRRHGQAGSPSLFATTLSGHDFWVLLTSGYRPVRVVMGCCVYQVGSQSWLASLAQTGKNVEVPTLTQALYGARREVLARMEEEAHAAKAEGIVGATVKVTHHTWNKHNVVEFFSLGTAVVPMQSATVLTEPEKAVNLRP